jgi:hypothetical protein
LRHAVAGFEAIPSVPSLVVRDPDDQRVHLPGTRLAISPAPMAEVPLASGVL